MLKTNKKFMCLLLAVCMLASMFTLPAAAAEKVKADADKGIAIFLEAEKGKTNGSTNTFETVSDKEASGGKYIISSDKTKTENPDVIAPEVTYKFTAEADGTYYVWMRYWCENNGSDSIFIGFNDEQINSQYGKNAEITGEAWGWCKMWSGNLKKGENTLKLYHREYNMKIDCFYISSDDKFVPSELETLKAIKEEKDREFLESRVVEPIGKINKLNDKGFCEIEVESSASQNLIIKDDKDASGKKMVEMPKPKGYDRDKPAYCNPPHVTLSVEIPKEANYYVWVRTFAENNGTDTSWICWDNGDYKRVDHSLYGEFAWIRAITQKLAAGIHTLNFVARENGMMIDKVIITTNVGYMPSGLGDTSAPMTYPAVYPTPSVLPPAGHPRVYFTADDIPRIKQNMSHPENAGAMEVYNKALEVQHDGKLAQKTTNNYNGAVLGYIQANAFDYAINGNTERGKKAIDMLKNYMATANYGLFDYNHAGHSIAVTGMVYDWCYDLLDDDTKEMFGNMIPVFATNLEVSWPPTKQGAVTGHGTEGQIYNDLLAAGIAMYDERSDIYVNSAGRIFKEMIEPRKFFYKMHLQPQGVHYASYRVQWEMLCTLLFDAIGYPRIFGDEQQYVMYQYLYTRRGDGGLMTDGDGSWNNAAGTYSTKPVRSMFLAGNYFKDPYLKKEAQRELANYTPTNVSSNQSLGPVEFLLFNDPSVESKSFAELPLTHYNPSPKGAMVARTGWGDGFDSPAVVAEMKINEYWTANHQHLDAGAFQIYYKGILATDTGYYQAYRTSGGAEDNDGNTNYGSAHWYNYFRRTIAHNSMLVYDPDEQFGGNHKSNDGGQRVPNSGKEVNTLEQLLDPALNYKTGEVLGHEFGLDPMEPNYSYLKGDIADAYSDKVKNFERSFMFLNLKNTDHPAAILVFDRVISSKESFKKTWLCHGMYEPEINGSRTAFKNTEKTPDGAEKYNGKLTIDTLLPKETSISKLGGEGHQHEVNGVNWLGKNSAGSMNEGDGWRVEISPAKENTEDYFLNVMQVGDADGAEALDAKLIETPTNAGAVIADRVVLFGKDRDRTSKDVSFSFDGEGSYEITVADLKEGTWSVTKDGGKIADAIVTADGGIAVFNGGSGSYVLSRTGDNAARPEITGAVKTNEGIDIKVNGKFIYSDVAPVIINDRTLIPMRAIFEKLGVDVTWDEASATATAVKDGHTVKITENSNTAYIDGNATELDVPAMILDGRFVVPVRFVSESFGAEVGWQEYGKIVSIKKSASSGNSNILGSIAIQKATQSGDDGNGGVISNSYDNDLTTRWAAEGKDGTAWGVYDLGQTYKLSKVMLAYHNGISRVYTFDIAVSNDGTNYTNVITGGKSSGKTDELESYDLGGVEARYVKYIGQGNTANLWNSVTEIVFVKEMNEKGYAAVNKISCSSYSDDFKPENVLDGDIVTIWSEKGEAYIDLELEKEYSVSAVEVILNPNSSRTALFDIYTSSDGKDWKLVKNCKGDPKGDGTKWEMFAFDAPIKTKYVRYFAKGSDISDWNAVRELRVKVND